MRESLIIEKEDSGLISTDRRLDSVDERLLSVVRLFKLLKVDVTPKSRSTEGHRWSRNFDFPLFWNPIVRGPAR